MAYEALLKAEFAHSDVEPRVNKTAASLRLDNFWLNEEQGTGGRAIAMT